MGRETSSSII